MPMDYDTAGVDTINNCRVLIIDPQTVSVE